MKLLGLGLNFEGEPLFQPMEESVLATRLVAALEPISERLQTESRACEPGRGDPRPGRARS